MKITPAICARLQEVKDGRLTGSANFHFHVERAHSLKVVPPTYPMVLKLEKAGLIVWVPNPKANEGFRDEHLAQLTPAGVAALTECNRGRG